MENIRNIVGSNIRIYRQAKKLTQEKLAEEIDVSSSYIGYLERGQKSPSLELLEKMAKALDITPALLLTPSPDSADQQLNHLMTLVSAQSASFITFMIDVASAYSRSLKKSPSPEQ